MKTPILQTSWFFVDESGDPTFYDRQGNLIVGQQGCSSLLLLGFIETEEPDRLRQAVLDLQKQVVSDSYFRTIPSLRKTAVAFHATDDVPEILYLFFYPKQLMAASSTSRTNGTRRSNRLTWSKLKHREGSRASALSIT